MMIYSQHFFRRRQRKIPSPSCLPFTIVFALLLGLVIAFMPPVISGVNVELPTLNTEPIEIYDDFTYTTIYVVNDKEVLIKNLPVNIEDTGEVIKEIHKKDNLADIKIFIKADKNANYHALMSILVQMNDIGVKDISLIGKYSGEKIYNPNKE